MLDHIIVLTEDLTRFRSQFEADTGVALTVGGAHPGIGTANLLASLGDGVYMEFMGPDPAFDTPHGVGARLAVQGAPRIGGFAARTADIGATAAAVEAAGLAGAPTAGSRAAPDGSVIAWTALFTGGHDYGDQVPFFIDWGERRIPRRRPHRGPRARVGTRPTHLRARGRAAGLTRHARRRDVRHGSRTSSRSRSCTRSRTACRISMGALGFRWRWWAAQRPDSG